MTFNAVIDRRNTGSSKWDMMHDRFGVPDETGLAMWTADSDYPTAPCVIDAVRAAADHGIFGYNFDYGPYHNAITWWMEHRHAWTIDSDWILTSQGLGNAIALCVDVWSQPGDGIAYFTPVYHEFRNKTENAGRRAVPLPLKRVGDRYELDLDDAATHLDDSVKVLLFCSPQNPSGRIWSGDELRAVAAFARDHDLILVSDEVHHDFIYPGHRFVPMDAAAPEARDRLVLLTAASKSFNVAGQKTGNMIIPDNKLRRAMKKRLKSLDYSPNVLGVQMVTAAYSPAGAAWMDDQIAHLNENRRVFDEGVDAIPGLHSLPLESTYLAWVDFSGTGMDAGEIATRIREDAQIVVSPGPAFGPGGELFNRFNLATPRVRVIEAVDRLQRAFADLQ